MSCDEYILQKENALKKEIICEYEMQYFMDKPIREYNSWKKNLTEEEKKDVYACALADHFDKVNIMARFGKVLPSVWNRWKCIYNR